MGVRWHRSIVMERGMREEASEFAGSVSNYVEQNWGVPVLWGLEVGGTVGKVHWWVDYDDMAHLEAIIAKSLTDEGYLSLVDSATNAFVGAAEDTIVYTM